MQASALDVSWVAGMGCVGARVADHRVAAGMWGQRARSAVPWRRRQGRGLVDGGVEGLFVE
jgi:hypothetical protein